MKNLIIVIALSALAGCTVYSGPTVNARPVGDAAGKQFEVECTGLFVETGSCLKKARELCEIQPGSPSLHVLETIGPIGRTPDRLVFRCDAPVKPRPPIKTQPPAAIVPPPVQPPEKVLFHGDALFDFDRADLKLLGKRALDDVIRQAKGKRFRVVLVSGYTDAIGSDAYNNALSARRARTVADYLRERGLLADRVVVNGFGKSNPVASNATDDGRAQNRRVEIILERE
ncbi:OmpA family protein [Burkholderia sp. ABCPW 111]|uniref:OmpA family protein n=1 Tax=Burkholderia sp. ABCPW 111 TaxID=1820025 RepID=UPI000531CAFB|nr:OmpA family protein [Burkholderia sp. ABCPW 111]KGR93203.1 ompA family protein [Burkholderia sp. ABCPW 111]